MTNTINGTYEPDCGTQDCYENASIEIQFTGTFYEDKTSAGVYLDKNNDDGSRGGWKLTSLVQSTNVNNLCVLFDKEPVIVLNLPLTPIPLYPH